MALTSDELLALQRADSYNGARYDSESNAFGLAGDGYKTNWPKGLNDTATLTTAVVREVEAGIEASAGVAAAQAAAEAAQSGAEGARDAAEVAQSEAAAARDAAVAAVSAVDLPTDLTGHGGEFLAVEPSEMGYELLPAAQVRTSMLDLSAVSTTTVTGNLGMLLCDTASGVPYRATVSEVAASVFATSGTLGAALNAQGQAIRDVGASWGRITTLADGGTITPNFSVGNLFKVTLGGNRTLANPSNMTPGQSGLLYIIQDGIGSRTLAWGSYWKWANATPPTLSTTAGAIDVVSFTVMSNSVIVATLPVAGAA